MPWPDRKIYVNPPFSKGWLAIRKCLVEFYRGRNIVLLLPEQSIISNRFFQEEVAQVCYVKKLGLVTFKQYNKPLHRSMVMIMLLQPSLLDEIAYNHIRNDPKSKHYIPPNKENPFKK